MPKLPTIPVKTKLFSQKYRDILQIYLNIMIPGDTYMKMNATLQILINTKWYHVTLNKKVCEENNTIRDIVFLSFLDKLYDVEFSPKLR